MLALLFLIILQLFRDNLTILVVLSDKKSNTTFTPVPHQAFELVSFDHLLLSDLLHLESVAAFVQGKQGLVAILFFIND